MADINQLTTTVVEREREKLNASYETFKHSVKTQTKERQDSLKQDYVARKLKKESQLSQDFERAKNSLKIKERDLKLQVKQSLMNEYIQDVKKALEQMDGQAVIALIQSVMNQLDSTDPQTGYELILGEKTRQLLGSQIDLPIRLSEETITNQAGFVIRQGSIEYNYLFEKLVQEKVTALQSLIVKEVFQSL